MDRRTFVLNGLAAATGAAAATRFAPAQVSGPRYNVLIIGAGLSGLVAGYELDKRGNDVKIIEARGRAGGRVQTVREFGEGLYGEAGAARIPRDHDLTHKYVKEFSLKLIPFYPVDGKFVRYWTRQTEVVDWDKFRDATSMVMGLNRPDVWTKIEGGNDLLPQAFAAQLGKKVFFDSPVRKIRHGPWGVEISFSRNNRLETMTGDLLICAVPFKLLTRIEVSPAFGPEKASAISSLEYDSASRVLLETKRRFWEDRKLNGFGFGDEGAEVWNSSFGEPGVHGLMQTYLRGGYSLELTRLAESERIERTLNKLSILFPDLRPNFVKGVSKCWSEDPWALGAWARYDRGVQAIGKRPEGRVFFAGEHLSDHGSWMQGALESGLRVVDQVEAFAPKAAAVLL
jgi:monoamine oxidase